MSSNDSAGNPVSCNAPAATSNMLTFTNPAIPNAAAKSTVFARSVRRNSPASPRW